MSHQSDLDRARHPRLSRTARAQGNPAFPDLRQRRRRQEHADRPAAARLEDDLRRPARRGALEEARRRPARFDLALLTDGLQAEREQGITIDVAYRYFSTTKRKFIIADTPGHEQYTRNMATGASGCDVAVILIDARHGVLTQTRRHTFIASLLGIRHVIVAINKMDLVDFQESVFDAHPLRLPGVHRKPRHRRSAVHSDLGAARRQRRRKIVAMPWYQGSTLMHLLENVQIASDRNFTDFRFAVQRVSRPDLDVPRLQRHGAERHRPAGRSRSSCCRRARRRRWRAS